jgi:opacity protein-like surface antigen
LFAVYPFKSASAQEGGYPAGYKTGGYIGLWGGFTLAPDLSSGSCDDWDCYKDDFYLDIDETPVFGVKIGFNHPRARALELEFEYSYLNPDITDYNTTVGDIKFNNFMFNIIAKIPAGVIHPYWGAGIGFSQHEISAKDIALIRGKNDTSFAWQLLTGLEIDLANNLALDIGYRYFVTQLEFNDTEDEHGNHSDVDFSTSMVTFGLKFLF